MTERNWFSYRRNFLKLSGAATLLLSGSALSRYYFEENSPLPTSKLIVPSLKIKPARNTTPIQLLASFDKNAPQIDMGAGEKLSRSFKIVNIFADDLDITKPEHFNTINRIIRQSQIPMISLSPWGNPIDDRFKFNRDITEYIKKIRSYAKLLSQFNSEIYLRFCYEMNGGWFQYGSHVNSPEDSAEGYRQFINAFKTEAPNMRSIWSPNVGDSLNNYYPGDEYVDYVALDGYNKSRMFPHPGVWNPNQSFYDLFAPSVAELQSLTTKPIIIAETNSARGGRFRIEWFNEAIRQASKWKGVTTLGGFFWNKGGRFDWDPNETNWEPDWHDFDSMLQQNPHVQQT